MLDGNSERTLVKNFHPTVTRLESISVAVFALQNESYKSFGSLRMHVINFAHSKMELCGECARKFPLTDMLDAPANEPSEPERVCGYCHNRMNDANEALVPGNPLPIRSTRIYPEWDEEETHEHDHWFVTIHRYEGVHVPLQDIMDYGCDYRRCWTKHGPLFGLSMPDVLHMHIKELPSWQPDRLEMHHDSYCVLFVAYDDKPKRTTTLMAQNEWDTIGYYVKCLQMQTHVVLEDKRLQNPCDTRFVFKSSGDWGIDATLSALAPLDAKLASLPQRPFVPGESVWVRDYGGDKFLTYKDAAPSALYNILDVLDMCSVTVNYLGRDLDACNDNDVRLLARWFPEPFKRLYMLRETGDAIEILCHGETTQVEVCWGTS